MTSPRPAFDLLPAIDLRRGRVVRLREGDFERETVYGGGPVATARAFAAAGARWIHVVDLDGARSGEPVQLPLVGRIVSSVAPAVRCEVAGGLRSEGAVEEALASGAARVVVGTAALQDPAFVASLVETHGAESVVVALDVRDGLALGEGWRPGAAGVRPEDALLGLAAAGARWFAATAIDRDGLLGGPDIDLLRRLVRLDAGDVIASGGITSLDDLRRVRDLGCAGAIVGRALYEGHLELATALETLADPG